MRSPHHHKNQIRYNGLLKENFLFSLNWLNWILNCSKVPPSAPNLGALDDVTVIHTCARDKPVPVSQCLWWTAFDGKDYGKLVHYHVLIIRPLLLKHFILFLGIISTMHGKLSVVDFYQQKEAYVLRMSNTSISKIEIVASDTYRVSPDFDNLVRILS